MAYVLTRIACVLDDDDEMEDYYADDKETEGLLHRCRILSQEMLFFLTNVQGFFMVCPLSRRLCRRPWNASSKP
jgi:hypothetical protein